MNRIHLIAMASLILITLALYRFKPVAHNPPAATTPMPTIPSTAFSPAKTPLKWGIYAGDKVNQFLDIQRTVGYRPDYLPVFVHWGNENQFPDQLAEYAYLQDQTLVIYWEAMDYNNPTPKNDSRFSYQKIINGEFDNYLTSFAASTKKYGRPVIIIPFEEMNGDWYPWSVTKNGNSPALHIAAYRHIRKFFADVPNVKFAWIINNDSVPDTLQNQPQTYFPGDNYVDIVGVDGFNFGDPWQSFKEVFDSPIATLVKFNKPILIASMSSAPGDAKAAWITDAAREMTKHPQVIGWIWFNENKEKDWRLTSDPASLQAFKTSLLSSP